MPVRTDSSPVATRTPTPFPSLTVGGRPVLVDPGTATYTMDSELRDRFRSTRMHNAVVVDGRMQAEPDGPFNWKSFVAARLPVWRALSDCDYMEGTHDSFAPRRHTRAILAVHGIGWWIMDHVLGDGAAAVESYWHLHPAWQCSEAGEHVQRLSWETETLAIASTFRLTSLPRGGHPLAVYSPAYGVVEPAPAVCGTASVQLPATFATFIPAKPEIAEQLQIEAVAIDVAPGPEWHACAFRVRWAGGTAAMLTTIERAGVATTDTAAPPERWGTAELRTDARLAMVIDHTAGRSEAILVNGAFIDAQPAHRLISLPRRVPLLRIVPSRLAPSVHEVGTGAAQPSRLSDRRLDS